jgi:TRAP transporter TAXI family solute receptor
MIMNTEPNLGRPLTLQFIGDWGQANFHRICSWLCQEVCDRTVGGSRVAIWNSLHGGTDAMVTVNSGEADMCLATPAGLLSAAITGDGIFSGRPMPGLRSLGVLPQNDRMVFAVDARFGVRTFADIREKRPPLRIATSPDNGFNLIGFVARAIMDGHGISESDLRSWGGEYVYAPRPEQSLYRMRDGLVDAVLQEAIMTPFWRAAMEARSPVVVPFEEPVLTELVRTIGLRTNVLPAGFLPGQPEAVAALDFSDFVIVVRDDMPEDVAYLITWCLVETRATIERQYRHLPPERSPLSYPLEPAAMAKTPLPLHPGAERYYRSHGHLTANVPATA